MDGPVFYFFNRIPTREKRIGEAVKDELEGCEWCEDAGRREERNRSGPAARAVPLQIRIRAEPTRGWLLGSGMAGAGWRGEGMQEGMLSREAQWERAKRCVAAVPRVDWQPSAGETGVRVSALSLTHSPSLLAPLPQLPSPPSGGQAGLGWLELSQDVCLHAVGQLLFIAPRSSLARSPWAGWWLHPGCPDCP